jgi:L-alanine-DL-glutamate epimerase-like enolase superfamily enzyme
MNLTAHTLDLTLQTPFRIARGVQRTADNVLAQLEADDLVGWGEAAPRPYYGEQRESVLIALSYLQGALGDDPMLIEDIGAAMERTLGGNMSARAAVDMALYDLMGQRLGVPLYQLLGLNPEKTPRTSLTIGIDTPEAMARRAHEARDFPILKIKLGTPNDLEIVRAIRDVTKATLRVDANAAWTPKEAVRTINALEPYDVEFVEQPVPAHELSGLRFVREHVALPIIADESCVTFKDVAKVAECADGINIKLMKCGGISQALKMIHAARAHGLCVMLGCMIESSLAITAAAHLSPLVDYADLDGPLLVADDPFEGVQIDAGRLVLPVRPGLGVRRRGHDARREMGKSSSAQPARAKASAVAKDKR